MDASAVSIICDTVVKVVGIIGICVVALMIVGVFFSHIDKD